MSTIQPTPPSIATAQGYATAVAQITAGSEALANTRPGSTVQVQVVSATPGGQITLLAPGGEITVQTSNAGSAQSQTPAQPQAQTLGQTPNQATPPAQGRPPSAIKPGDVYNLRVGPRGSETISLSPQRTATSPSQAAQKTEPPTPRAEGSVPIRLVPGAVTTATIIPRSGETVPRAQQATPAQTSPSPGPPLSSRYPKAPPPPQMPPASQIPPTAPSTTFRPLVSDGDLAPIAPASAPISKGRLAPIASAGTGALLRTALQAARDITEGTVRQASPPGGHAEPNIGRDAPPVRTALVTNLAPSPTPQATFLTNQAAPLVLTPPIMTIPAKQDGPLSNVPVFPPGASANPTIQHAATSSPPPTAPTPNTAAPAGSHPGQTRASSTTGTSSLTAGSTAQRPIPPVSGASATTPAGLLTQFTQIQRVDIKILAIQHPGATATNATSTKALPQGTVVSGTVIGQSRAGQSILSTTRGLMTLFGRADFPPGSLVELEILPRSTNAETARMTAPPPAPLLHLARHWETLDQAIRLLETANPFIANQITQNHVGRPGPQLTAAIALFITAVRGGDLRAWLGEETTRALEQARGALAANMREEFGTMQRASEPNDRGWRGFFIPFMDDGQLNQIRLFLHQENNKGDGDGGGEADRARFVVDLSLSQLGDLQIDGSVQPKTVDLLIRTRDTLPSAMRQDIRNIFTATLARTGIDGQLAFRAQKTFPALPIETLHGHQDGTSSNLHI